jgi:hypothetical protein
MAGTVRQAGYRRTSASVTTRAVLAGP